MIILDVKFESLVQVNDATRIDCSRSSEVDSLEIDLGGGYMPFYDGENLTDRFFDFAIESANESNLIKVRATKGAETKEKTISIKSVTEEEDGLFSSDEDLLDHEEDIHRLLRPGKMTFKNIHRLAQKEIVRDLNERNPKLLESLTKASIVEKEQVRAWSKYLTLHYIFESNVRSTDDFHVEKSRNYLDMAHRAAASVSIKTDLDGDGKTDSIESFSSIGLSL